MSVMIYNQFVSFLELRGYLAIFILSGNIPVQNDWLIMRDNGRDKYAFKFLTSFI